MEKKMYEVKFQAIYTCKMFVDASTPEEAIEQAKQNPKWTDDMEFLELDYFEAEETE